MLRCALVLLLTFAPLAFTSAAHCAESPLKNYDRVEIAPTKTSIYIGTVSMTLPTLPRAKGVYSASYVAKVFPYFFSSEKGQLSIDISDEMLRQLERGEPVEFKGRAVNRDGEERRVEGKAAPDDAKSGKLKVRVFVSKRIELIFNTTYRVPDAK
jgi:hypothetical protein